MSKPKTVDFTAIWQRLNAVSWPDKRVMFRAIVAADYELFEPQDPQIGTKVNVREHTHRLMQWMGEYVPKSKPGHIEDESTYMPAWLLVRSLDKPERRCILSKIIELWIENFQPEPAKRNFARHNLAALASNLSVMQQQHMANLSGWKYTGEYLPKERTKREKRAGINR
jgi:hypothetical protein